MANETWSDEAARLIEALRVRGWLMATAESCTGGLVAAAITSVPGASDVFDRGFVTYSNRAKSQTLGVDGGLIASVGAVSADVARAMADGALMVSGCQAAVSVTGITGPGGGSREKPVGLVFIGVGVAGSPVVVERHVFPDAGRDAIRQASVGAALRLLCSRVETAPV